MSPRRILVLQLARLGDLVQTWPLLRKLRQAYPEARLSLLADRSLADLAGMGPRVDDLYALDLREISFLASQRPEEAYRRLARLLMEWQNPGFDLVFNLNFSRLSLLTAYLLGGRVIGYQPVHGGREFWREPWLALVYGLVHARAFNRLHLSDVFRHLAPISNAEPAARPAKASPAGEPVIALQLATRHPRRTWPLGYFSRLAGLLVEKLGARIWLLGTAAERPLGEELLSSLEPPLRERLVNLQGRTDLAELAGRLAEADLVVSGDTGTLHLAAALGTPVTAIFFGPASCFETGPYGPGHVVLQAEPTCHPCREAEGDCEAPFCQRMITPELVAGAVLERFGQNNPYLAAGIPPSVRIYESFWDGFGVNYAIRRGRPPGWADLVGWAYRAAGARLLKLPPPRWPSPFDTQLSSQDFRALLGLVDMLKNGIRMADDPSVDRALVPLRAFGQVLARQAAWKGSKSGARAWFKEVKVALGQELAQFIR